MTYCLLIFFCSPIFLLANLKYSAGQPIGQKTKLVFPQAINNINTIYIPFTLVGRLISVQARVDTLSGIFFFDTGSERLILNQSHFYDGYANEQASMSNSGAVNSSYQKVDSFHIDRFFVLDVLAHVVNLKHIEQKKNIRLLGIIGFNVFKDFSVLIDYPNQRLVLRRLAANGQEIDFNPNLNQLLDSIHFVLKGHLITFPVTVNGKKLRMALDSGAEVNLLDKRVSKKVLQNFEILRRVKMVGIGKSGIEVLAGRLYEVECASMELEGMHTLLTNLENINDAFGTRLHGVLGYEFMQGKRILINYQLEKLYFLKPVSP